MMYQILCGHVNYALGKTRMQVKKQKDTLFWIHVYINLLKILKSYCQQYQEWLPLLHGHFFTTKWGIGKYYHTVSSRVATPLTWPPFYYRMGDRKILLNCFLKSGYPSYMATFLLQNGGQENTTKLFPQEWPPFLHGHFFTTEWRIGKYYQTVSSRVATLLTWPLFYYRKGRLLYKNYQYS